MSVNENLTDETSEQGCTGWMTTSPIEKDIPSQTHAKAQLWAQLGSCWAWRQQQSCGHGRVAGETKSEWNKPHCHSGGTRWAELSSWPTQDFLGLVFQLRNGFGEAEAALHGCVEDTHIHQTLGTHSVLVLRATQWAKIRRRRPTSLVRVDAQVKRDRKQHW